MSDTHCLPAASRTSDATSNNSGERVVMLAFRKLLNLSQQSDFASIFHPLDGGSSARKRSKAQPQKQNLVRYSDHLLFSCAHGEIL